MVKRTIATIEAHSGISAIIKDNWEAAWGSVSAQRDRRCDAAIVPWLQTQQYQTLTAISSVAANELAFVGLFNGQQTRNYGRSSARPDGLLYRKHSLWRSSRRVRTGVLT